MKKLILATALVLAFAAPVLAVPSLQLDIQGGTFDWAEESVLTAAGDFTLYALLTPDSKARLTDQYYISVAVYPSPGEAGADLGDFTFNGTTMSVTGDMIYGTAPLDAYLQTWDNGDLQPHSVFPTYFYQSPAFTFDSTLRTTTYNVQEEAGGTLGGLDPNPNGGTYYKPFEVADAFLADGYFLHFDLYSIKNGKDAPNDTDRWQFAPFSHDAGTTRVPEPGSLLLLGVGLVGIASLRKKLL